MDCCCTSIKYLLFIFNFIFLLGGLAILTVGAFIQWNLNFYDDIFGVMFAVPAILLIVIGSAIFIISFFGCFGAIRESNCMLYTYVCTLTIVLIGLLTGAVLAFTTASRAEDDVRSTLKKLMSLYQSGGSEGTAAVETWDITQKSFECCGVDGPSDWWALQPPMEPPASCSCSPASNICNGSTFSRGCFEPVHSFIKILENVLGGIALAFAILAVSGIFFSCLLAGAIKKERENKFRA